MRKSFVSVLLIILSIGVGFLVEPLFPLGDWRWGVVIAFAALGIVFLYLPEIRQHFKTYAWDRPTSRKRKESPLRHTQRLLEEAAEELRAAGGEKPDTVKFAEAVYMVESFMSNGFSHTIWVDFEYFKKFEHGKEAQTRGLIRPLFIGGWYRATSTTWRTGLTLIDISESFQRPQTFSEYDSWEQHSGAARSEHR